MGPIRNHRGRTFGRPQHHVFGQGVVGPGHLPALGLIQNLKPNRLHQVVDFLPLGADQPRQRCRERAALALGSIQCGLPLLCRKADQRLRELFLADRGETGLLHQHALGAKPRPGIAERIIAAGVEKQQAHASPPAHLGQKIIKGDRHATQIARIDHLGIDGQDVVGRTGRRRPMAGVVEHRQSLGP